VEQLLHGSSKKSHILLFVKGNTFGAEMHYCLHPFHSFILWLSNNKKAA